MKSPLVSTDWLYERLNDQYLLIIQATMSKIIGKKPLLYPSPVFIPNAVKVDIETDLSDLTSNMAHAFPSEQQFNDLAQSIGITRDHTIVIYDDQGVYAAPRAWWICKAFGVENVFILDGGLPKWLQEHKPVTAELGLSSGVYAKSHFLFQPELVRNAEFVKKNIRTKQYIVADARAEERFLGLAAEPRPGLRSGHIPNSVNLPFGLVLDDICYKSPDVLNELFNTFSHDPAQPFVFSCGSGVTGCIILVAALIAGRSNVSLYDGSWSEWGADSSLPIER